MKITQLLPIIIMLLLSMTLASCAGIGDGGMRANEPLSGSIPVVYDGDQLQGDISLIDTDGVEDGKMALANGGVWQLYEYFSESEYKPAEGTASTAAQMECIALELDRKERNGQEFSDFCVFKVYTDDYVSCTYTEKDTKRIFEGFLEEAYDKLDQAFESALSYYERQEGFRFDSLLVSSDSAITFTRGSFPEIDCVDVNYLFKGDDGTTWWTIYIDSVTKQEIVDTIEKLKEREDISFAQHNYIYTLD